MPEDSRCSQLHRPRGHVEACPPPPSAPFPWTHPPAFCAIDASPSSRPRPSSGLSPAPCTAAPSHLPGLCQVSRPQGAPDSPVYSHPLHPGPSQQASVFPSGYHSPPSEVTPKACFLGVISLAFPLECELQGLRNPLVLLSPVCPAPAAAPRPEALTGSDWGTAQRLECGIRSPGLGSHRLFTGPLTVGQGHLPSGYRLPPLRSGLMPQHLSCTTVGRCRDRRPADLRAEGMGVALSQWLHTWAEVRAQAKASRCVCASECVCQVCACLCVCVHTEH